MVPIILRPEGGAEDTDGDAPSARHSAPRPSVDASDGEPPAQRRRVEGAREGRWHEPQSRRSEPGRRHTEPLRSVEESEWRGGEPMRRLSEPERRCREADWRAGESECPQGRFVGPTGIPLPRKFPKLEVKRWSESTIPDGAPAAPPPRGRHAAGDVTICYFCHTNDVPGRFYPKRAAALGLKPGPAYGKLSKGESVTLPDGSTITPEQVRDDPVPGRVVGIFDVPTSAHLASLLAHEKIASYKGLDSVAVVYHFTPEAVVGLPAYVEWMGTFHKSTVHIVVNATTSPPVPAFTASTSLLCKLHAVQRAIFPLPHPLSESVTAMGGSSSGADESSTVEGVRTDGRTVVAGRLLQRFELVPLRHAGLDNSSSLGLPDPAQLMESVSADAKLAPLIAANDAAWRSAVSAADTARVDPEFEVSFLGTSSAIPSKYRNVTGIYAILGRGRALMMDAGEGTYGQLVRKFGRVGDGDATSVRRGCGRVGVTAALNAVKVVWVSHMHADHHLGLPRIICQRTASQPLLVIGPTRLQEWLQEFAVLDRRLRDRFYFVDAASFLARSFEVYETAAVAFPSGAFAGHDDPRAIAEGVLSAVGLSELRVTLVEHCYQAYGIRISTSEPGLSVVYSGDTVPCDALVELGRGCDVLIHEATFEDGMEEEASAKKHSTTAQALDVWKRMGARYLILTHFSARYPKLPSLGGLVRVEDSEAGDAVDATEAASADSPDVGIAYDLVTISGDDLPHLHLLLPVLSRLLASETAAAAAADAAEAAATIGDAPAIAGGAGGAGPDLKLTKKQHKGLPRKSKGGLSNATYAS